MQYNSVFETVVSIDTSGMLEYWTGPKHECKFPKTVNWQYKTDTDLYELAKVRQKMVIILARNAYIFL